MTIKFDPWLVNKMGGVPMECAPHYFQFTFNFFRAFDYIYMRPVCAIISQKLIVWFRCYEALNEKRAY